jgi:hypothetical protein
MKLLFLKDEIVELKFAPYFNVQHLKFQNKVPNDELDFF